MRRRISLLIVVLLLFTGCRSNTSTSQLEASNLIDSIRINTDAGLLKPLPIANHGLTVVKLFDEFCSECPTGNRFQTVTRLSESPHPPSKILLVFSDEHFSSDDVENFRTLLSNDALVKGNIAAAKPHLNNGKLLVVFDSNRKIVWHEKPGMKEEEVLAAVSHLF